MLNTLVVEDNPGFRESFISLLKEHFSFMVFEKAGSSEEAMVKLNRFSPQLIFLDIHLPGENGLQFSRTLRSRYQDAVIVMLTNHDGPEYRSAAAQFGVNHFFSKGGVSMDDIFSIVDGMVSEIITLH